MKPSPTKPTPLHIYYDELSQAKQEAYRLGSNWFRSWVDGKLKFSVRVKNVEG